MDAAQLKEFYRQIGEAIRQERKVRGLSQDDLAKLVGLTRTSLTNIESGRQHPPLHTFCEIVEQLGVDFTKLLPRSVSVLTAAEITTLASKQVRHENELEFIQAGLRMIGRNSDGYSQKKNSSNDNGAS